MEPASLHDLDKYPIQVGRAADLVLLDMNPVEDIRQTRKIHSVVVGGKFFPLASITAQALQDAANRQ